MLCIEKVNDSVVILYDLSVEILKKERVKDP